MDGTWQRRIERTRELGRESPVLPELLDFYRQIARFQAAVAEGPAPPNLEALLALIRRTAPAWEDTLRGADPMHAFFGRVLLQANAARRARRNPVPVLQSRCPGCAEMPVAAVLRPAGPATGRFLLCGRCLEEWEYPGVLCLHCGEADPNQFRFHADDEFPHIRMVACDTCRVYLKEIDVTLNGRAVPEVDELASVVLDLWAAEHGYTKLQSNLFGL